MQRLLTPILVSQRGLERHRAQQVSESPSFCKSGGQGGRMAANSAVKIRHDREKHLFETEVEGHRAYLAYMDLGKHTLDFYRTFVPDELRGQGIAALLTQNALEFANKEGYSVIPSCSYVEAYLRKNVSR